MWVHYKTRNAAYYTVFKETTLIYEILNKDTSKKPVFLTSYLSLMMYPIYTDQIYKSSSLYHYIIHII